MTFPLLVVHQFMWYTTLCWLLLARIAHGDDPVDLDGACSNLEFIALIPRTLWNCLPLYCLCFVKSVHVCVNETPPVLPPGLSPQRAVTI